jgi:NAD(P) transhydrogenase subunit beta
MRPEVLESIRNLIYLAAAALFIFGLKGLSHPRLAVRGNLLGALGMLLASAVTLLTAGMDYRFIAAGFAIGAVIGWVMAIRVQMTGMPEMVALFNGFGALPRSWLRAGC